MNNNSSKILVSQMQQYINNLTFQQQQGSSSNSLYSSTPIYQQQQLYLSPNIQQSITTPPNNTQILFSNNYGNINQNYSSSSSNASYEQINHFNAKQQTQSRPITKKLSINTSFERQSSPTSSSFSSTPPYSSFVSSTSYSPYSSCDSNQIFNYTPIGSPICSKMSNKNKKTPKKTLPIRSDTIDMSAHIELAKRLKQVNNKILICSFCKNNKESEDVCSSHLLKDSTGKITCPILRTHVCPSCGGTGDNAHTITYCKDLKKSKRLQDLQQAVNQICNQ